MKTKMSSLLTLLLIAATWIIPGQTQALLFIPGDSRSGIMITETAMDDPGDYDQVFPSDRNVIVQIDNKYRRYVGVVIDRSIQGQTSSPVDNGPNDRLIGLGSKLISVDTLTAWALCVRAWGSPLCAGYLPSSRNYVLPVPNDAVPGSEVKFRLRFIGPAVGSTTVPDSDIDEDLTRETTGYTLWEVVARDLVKLCLGGLYPDPAASVIMVQELMNDLKYAPGFWHAVDKGDYMGMYDGLVNWLIRSEYLKMYAEIRALTGSTSLLEALQDLSGTLKAVTIVEMVNALTQLTDTKWQETYEVVVVIPKINDIQPALGKTGDPATIHGVGFDPYKQTNNHVFFTALNKNGVPVLIREARVLGVWSEGTMTVEVPADFEPGPVMVCTGKYCSNTDVVFGTTNPNPLPTGLSIIAPSEGAEVSGTISVAAVVPSPPVPFPASVGRLLVDGGEVTRKDVITSDFSFVLDTSTLTDDAVHTLTVELITADQTLSASVQVVLPVKLVITSPAADADVTGVININARVRNPPNPFPTSQATLFLDGQQVDQQDITSATFGFQLNTASLAAGIHSLQINLSLSGEVYVASINVTVPWYPSQDPGYGASTTCQLLIKWDSAPPYFRTGWTVTQRKMIYFKITPLDSACRIKAYVTRQGAGGWCGNIPAGCTPFPRDYEEGTGPGAPVTLTYNTGQAISCCPADNGRTELEIRVESMSGLACDGRYVRIEMAAPPSMISGSPFTTYPGYGTCP